ncbi:universal stress protein [Oceaniglobus ichthyenteri]|uniref:universal stress protein n=1 Tax=Oceaniglobus ichthyenteri TaxID=2136177 RepID=UPI000D35E77D|nr:universal stress protein [Oceaniglobus ichthyenteri]
MQPMITNILFATDLSENSTYALRNAASLAQATRAEIHVLHVSEPLSDDARVALEMFMLNAESRKRAIEQRGEMIAQLLDERQERFWSALTGDAAKIREQVTSIEVIEGHPAEVILRRARELKCDLIVLGAHDHGFTQTFLGTVAKRVLRRADIPTLIVPYNDDGRNIKK